MARIRNFSSYALSSRCPCWPCSIPDFLSQQAAVRHVHAQLLVEFCQHDNRINCGVTVASFFQHCACHGGNHYVSKKTKAVAPQKPRLQDMNSSLQSQVQRSGPGQTSGMRLHRFRLRGSAEKAQGFGFRAGRDAAKVVTGR